MDLIPFIYYEKQEPGSMLCAQHALNNLIQSPLWSPDNLAEIARRLDSIESSHLDLHPHSRSQHKSPNYDDSGFFSVQVIDDALHPLGLRIASWKSEEMKPMHDYPENQEAFILNHDLHWFTLRRFGQSVDRWYNLNSMDEESPKWIGPTFLSLSIAQAEAEGYSIFVVIPLPSSSDSSAPQPGRLITCEADEQALILDQLNYSSSSTRISSGSSASLRRPREDEIKDESSSRTRMKLGNENQIHDLTEEDQIQIAIQASLTQSSSSSSSSSNSNQMSQRNFHPKPNAKINSMNGIKNDLDGSSHHHHLELNPKGQVDTLPESETSGQAMDSNATISNECFEVTEGFESLEDKELAIAIAESLLDHTNHVSDSNSNLPPLSDNCIDEPTPDELRQKRLARFSSSS